VRLAKSEERQIEELQTDAAPQIRRCLSSSGVNGGAVQNPRDANILFASRLHVMVKPEACAAAILARARSE
jgi:hypothetical protein